MRRKRPGAGDLLILALVALGSSSALAISHDAATQSTTFTTGSPEIFDHTPAGTPRGVLVFIAQDGASDDQITRVTYGGVPLNRVWSASDTAGESGRVYGFFLGNAVPTGTQSVAIVHSGDSQAKVATAITVTGSNDIEILPLPGRLQQDQADPQIALDSGSKEALRYDVIFSGSDSVADLTPLSGMTALSGDDFGSSVARVDRETSATTGSTTIGYAAASQEVAMLAVGLAEITAGGGGSGLVPHVAKVVTTPDTETGESFVAVSGASISAAELDAAGIDVGDPVYLQVIAHLGNGAGGARSAMALAHGSTHFRNLESETIQPEVYSISDGVKNTPFLHYLWTRAPGEDIELQFARVDGGTAEIDQVFLLALGLSGLERGVDWFWSEVGEELALVHGDEHNGPLTDGASITVLPSEAIDRFAVFTTAYLEHAIPLTTKPRTQLTRSGEVSDIQPHQGFFGGAATQRSAMGLMRVYALSAGARSNFVLQDNQSGTSSSSRELSSIFGLNLDRFRTASSGYTLGLESLSSTSYGTLLQSIDITPSSQSPVWIVGFWGYDPITIAGDAEFRVRVDGVDDPAGQTADNHRFNGEVTSGGSQGYFVGSVSNLDPSQHGIDLDASATGSAGGEIRSLFAVELAYFTPQIPALGPLGLVALGVGLALGARVSRRAFASRAS